MFFQISQCPRAVVKATQRQYVVHEPAATCASRNFLNSDGQDSINKFTLNEHGFTISFLEKLVMSCIFCAAAHICDNL